MLFARRSVGALACPGAGKPPPLDLPNILYPFTVCGYGLSKGTPEDPCDATYEPTGTCEEFLSQNPPPNVRTCEASDPLGLGLGPGFIYSQCL